MYGTRQIFTASKLNGIKNASNLLCPFKHVLDVLDIIIMIFKFVFFKLFPPKC